MERITKKFKKIENEIDLLLQKIKQTNSVVFYHKLRVEIKKLNAFLNLIKFCSRDFNKVRVFKPYKLIFRQAGKIRELQIEEGLLKKYFINNELLAYKNYLQKRKKKEELCLFKIINESFIAKQKSAINEIKPFLEKIDTKKGIRYLIKEENKISKLLTSKNLKKSRLHKLRKRLKIYYYNKKNIDLIKLDKTTYSSEILLQLMGEWHDYQITKNHLKKALRTGKTNPTESNKLRKVKTKIAIKKREMFKKIKRTITTSYSIGSQKKT